MSIFEDYLESAVSDRPHSNIDRFILEDEMNRDPLSGLAQKPQHSISVPRTPHPEDALPIGQGAKIIGNIIRGKYVPDRVLKKRIADSKLADSFAEKIKELKKFIDDRGFMGYASSSEITKAKKKMKELRDSYDELRPAMKGRNFQQGGPAERPPLLGYMQPGGPVEYAVQDETANSQMDWLLFEDEMSQQPQHFMRAYQEGYDPAKAIAEGDFMPAGLIGKTGKGGFNLLKKLFPSKTAKAGKQILKEGSSKIKRASKLPEEFASVTTGDKTRRVGVAEFTDDAGNIIKQPMYQSTGTSGYAGKRAGEWMPFLGERGGGYHKGRYALGKGGKPVSHMIDLDKYGRVMKESLSPRMKKILPSKSKFDWEARMTGPTGPDTGRMKQLSYDIKQLENKLDDLPVDDVKFEDLNKWLRKQGAELPERSWIPETYQQGGPAERPPPLAYMQPGGLVEHIKGLSAIPPLIYDALKSASTGYTSYSKAKPLVENATQFLTDWYSHPETIKNLQKNLSQEEIDDIQSRTQKLQEARFRPSVPFIESGFKNIFSMLSGGNELLPEPSESKSGRTIRHGSPTMMPSGARGMHSTIFGDISLSPLQSPSSYGSTAIHEGEHFINPYAKKEIESLKGPFPRIGPKVHGIGTRYPDERAYIRSPNEIRARIMELRNVLDIKPGEKVSKDKLKTFNEIITPKKGREIRAEEMFYYDRLKRDYEKKTGNPRGEIVPYLDLKIRGKYDDDDILWFLNNLAMETEEEDSGVLMAQQGGHAPPLAYMQPGGPVEYAVQDETANSQMDRLMFENELEQQPQHSMVAHRELPQWPMPEDALPIGGALRLLKGAKNYKTFLKSVSKTAAKEKKNWETMTDLARGGSKGQIKETPKEFLKWYKKDADKSGKDYVTTKWIQKVLEQNPF